MALLVRLPLASLAERASGEKALALQHLIGRDSGGGRGGLFPFRELLAHDGRNVTDIDANASSR
jgi:hypothetical protein